MIQLIRIDDRLIHGQVVIGWASNLNSEEIILCDNIVCRNEWEKELYLSCTPENLKALILDENQTMEILKHPERLQEKSIVLVNGPEVVERFAKAGIKLPTVNVGGLHFKEGRKNFLPYLYLSDEEIESFKRCMQMGVHFECLDVPTGTRIDLADVIG